MLYLHGSIIKFPSSSSLPNGEFGELLSSQVVFGLSVGVGVGVIVGVCVLVGVAVGELVTVGVGVLVDVGVGVSVAVGVRLGVIVGVLVGVPVGVDDRVGVIVGVLLAVNVGVILGVCKGVIVGVGSSLSRESIGFLLARTAAAKSAAHCLFPFLRVLLKCLVDLADRTFFNLFILVNRFALYVPNRYF